MRKDHVPQRRRRPLSYWIDISGIPNVRRTRLNIVIVMNLGNVEVAIFESGITQSKAELVSWSDIVLKAYELSLSGS